jgi:competence protein ComEA
MKIKIIMSCLLLFIALGLYISRAQSGSNEEISLTSNNQNAPGIQTNSAIPEVKIIIVDVSGEVNKPGIIKLPADSRVYQAIELAGGLKKSAESKNINLAAFLIDGEKIYVGKVGDEALQSGLNAKGLVNINTANSETLQTISGIGPSTAEKIISYRDSKGRFNKIEDIKNISGIGEKTFEKLKMKICVN